MKKIFLLGALLTAGAIGLQGTSTGHGGTYRGPGDTVPPGGGGGGGGGGAPPTPGPAGPSQPGQPGRPTPGPAVPGVPGGSGPSQPPTGGGPGGPDLTMWQFWWAFNREPYLNLKAHVDGGATFSGSDKFFLGSGQRNEREDSLRPSPETIRQKVVPALLHALENETDNDVVTACLVALAKIGDEEAEDGTSAFEEVIRKYLPDSNQEIKETAAVALGLLANPVSIETLAHIVSDDPTGRDLTGDSNGIDYRTRAFATYGLGLIGYRTGNLAARRRIVAELWRVLEEPRFATRDIKVAALIAMGLVPLDVVEQVPAEGDAGKKAGQVPVADWTRKDQIEYLLGFFADARNKDRNYLVRSHAPRSIALLLEGAAQYKERVVAALLPYVGRKGEGQVELRRSCTLAFGQLGDLDGDDDDVAIRAALMEAGESADALTRNFSMIALGQVGGRPGAGAQPQAGLVDVQSRLLRALGRGKRQQVKPWAGLALGVMQAALVVADAPPSADVARALRDTFREESSPEAVGAYAIGLGIARDIESEQALLTKLDDLSQDDARGDIAIGLGLMGSTRAVATIQEIVKTSKYRAGLLKSAAIALGLLGDKNVVPDLTAMLRDGAGTLSTQAAIASALGFIGDSRSVDPLVEMLQNAELTPKARAFAAVALGLVSDKELLPWNSKISVDINYTANTTTLTSPEGTGILDIL